MPDFSDYIVYVDESGDHGLKNINQSYPMFCLAFCIFEKANYIQRVVPAFQQLKFDYWGHDAVILHEHEIRKQYGDDYRVLRYGETRAKFLGDMARLLASAKFSIIKNVQNKSMLATDADVYGLSLQSCMITLLQFLEQNGSKKETVHLIFESRGKNEDRALKLVFQRICDGILDGTEMFRDAKIKFIIKFAKKAVNSTGLQIADLVARPIGLSHFRPKQRNRAYDIIREKIYQSPK